MPENVATPATAFSVVVPDNVPPPGFAPKPNVTAPVKFVTVLPCASFAITAIAGAMPAPAVVVPGDVVNWSVAGAAAVTANVALVTVVKPLAAAVSVYPTPGALMLRLVKFTTPLTAATDRVPVSVPPPEFVPIAMVTVLEALLTMLLSASRISTWTWGITAPTAVEVGCSLNASCVGPPLVTLNAMLVALGSPVALATSV